MGGDAAQNGLKFAGGEQATAVMGLLLLCRPSEARSLENMASASGKLGGVAGVLLGVHICKKRREVSVRWQGMVLVPLAHRQLQQDSNTHFPQSQ